MSEGFWVGLWVVDEATGDSGKIIELHGSDALVTFGRRSHADEWIPFDDLEVADEQPG